MIGTTCSRSRRDNSDRRRRRRRTRHRSFDRDGTHPSALRAYALLDLPVEEVSSLVDRKVESFRDRHCRHGRLRRHRSALRHDDHRRGRASTAGDRRRGSARQARHDPSRATARLRAGQSILVGNVRDRPRSRARALHGRSGRTTRRTDRRWDRRLRAAITPAPPAEVTANLMHQLVGKISTRDDIAVVVLRRT